MNKTELVAAMAKYPAEQQERVEILRAASL